MIRLSARLLVLVVALAAAPAFADEPSGTSADTVEVAVAADSGEAGDAGETLAPAEDLSSIREQLADVQRVLAESQKVNQRIFILLFLAIIILIVNIIVSQRRR